MGTSITGSGTVESLSKNWSTSRSLSTVCGTGASRICTMGATRTRSVMCSMVCLWTRSCGRGGSARLAGRLPPGSSSYRLKSTGWGGGVVRNLAVYFVSLSSSPALAFLCPREEWCNVVAKAAAIDCSSCRHHERSRRCFLRCAALIKGCSLGSISQVQAQKRGARLSQTPCCCCCCCCFCCCCVVVVLLC